MKAQKKIIQLLYAGFFRIKKVDKRKISSKIEKMITTKTGGTYEHFKGKKYRIIALAHHSETLEEMVVYECLYNNPRGKIWVRPRKMFEEKVSVDGKIKERFKKIV